MEEDYKRKYFFYKWRIENFNFCGLKTGAKLESPLFHVESSPKTSWKLWLYPRGEDNGEYVSCYLYRADEVPEVIDVDFELSVSVGERLVKPPVSFENIYLFANHQAEGDKSLALRREIFLCKPPWEERCTLTIGCKIFKCNGERLETVKCFGRTAIGLERISGMEVLFDDAALVPINDKDIEVKRLCEDDPLININLSYADEKITIKIQPKECAKIKFATCKITVLINRLRSSPIEHVRSWVGEIKEDIWRYDSPQSESTEQEVATNPRDTIFLRYDFSYSTGVQYSNDELHDYGTDLWLENIALLESSCEIVKTDTSEGHVTFMHALEPSYTTRLFADVTIKTETTSFDAHKAVLRARSSVLEDMLKGDPRIIDLGVEYTDDIIRRFLLFLYTDRMESLFLQKAIDLYKMAYKYNVELLKKKCREFLEMNCDPKKVSDLLLLAQAFKDQPLYTHFMKFIVEHDEEVFSTDEWQVFADRYWLLAEECMLLKYRNKLPAMKQF